MKKAFPINKKTAIVFTTLLATAVVLMANGLQKSPAASPTTGSDALYKVTGSIPAELLKKAHLRSGRRTLPIFIYVGRSNQDKNSKQLKLHWCSSDSNGRL